VTTTPLPRGLVLATLVPMAIGVLVLIGFVIAEQSGSAIFTYGPPRNLAEAAAIADAAEVMRLLRAGEDPTAVMAVRPEVISSSIKRVTALEASIWGREVELVRMLDREGAIQGDQRRRDLACLSEALKADAITKYLAPDGTNGCEAVDAVRRIEARAE
jgi:hypothetical protein